MNHKAHKFKVGNKVRISKYKKIFNKGFTDNWSREVFLIDSVMKNNPWTFKIKDSNGKNIIRNFYEKELLWKVLWFMNNNYKRLIIQTR